MRLYASCSTVAKLAHQGVIRSNARLWSRLKAPAAGEWQVQCTLQIIPPLMSAAGSIHHCCRPRSSGLLAESSFGALAVEADSMEDKLQLVQTKRR